MNDFPDFSYLDEIAKLTSLITSNPALDQAAKLAAQIDPLPWAEFSQLSEAWQNVLYTDYSWIHEYESLIANLPQIIPQNLSRWEAWHKNALTLANFGWVLNLGAPLIYLDNAPISIEEANQEMMAYLPNNVVQQMCDEILTNQFQYIELKEAFLCYENQSYRACTMILLSVIDRRLAEFNLRYKPDELYKELKRKHITKPVGATALQGVKEKLGNLGDSHLGIRRLAWLCLFRVLDSLFANGKDFKSMPLTINRNFLMHGFYDGALSKTDCVKLILVLHTFESNLCSEDFII